MKPNTLVLEDPSVRLRRASEAIESALSVIGGIRSNTKNPSARERLECSASSASSALGDKMGMLPVEEANIYFVGSTQARWVLEQNSATSEFLDWCTAHSGKVAAPVEEEDMHA